MEFIHPRNTYLRLILFFHTWVSREGGGFISLLDIYHQ